MYYHNLPNQLLFTAEVCVSFFIFLYTLCLCKGKTQTKLLGISFIVPLVLSVASFFTQRSKSAAALSLSSEFFLLLALFLLLILKPKARQFNQYLFSLYVFPFLFILLENRFDQISSWLARPMMQISLWIAVTLTSLFVLRKERGLKSLIPLAFVCELASIVTEIFGDKYPLNYLAVFFRIGAFILFLIYFYKEIHDTVMKTVSEAEKKLAAVNKSLDLEVKKRVFEIELSNERLVSISKTDSLTKALNKAGILDKIDSLMNTKRNPQFCILMFDIDFFKTINDTMGHITGDKCLKKLSLIAQKSIRDIDFLGRYGGDEFIILLPGATVSQAAHIAERFRKNVAETESPHFTVSIGIASFPEDGITVKELIAAADEGLYMSKKKGKNAVSYRNQ